ncbi:MAG: hypothetical protein ACXVH3_38335 [Solirubrobacteraceae bacterium]
MQSRLPLVIASIVFVALVTWRKGREIVTINRSREEGPLVDQAERIQL